MSSRIAIDAGCGGGGGNLKPTSWLVLASGNDGSAASSAPASDAASSVPPAPSSAPPETGAVGHPGTGVGPTGGGYGTPSGHGGPGVHDEGKSPDRGVTASTAPSDEHAVSVPGWLVAGSAGPPSAVDVSTDGLSVSTAAGAPPEAPSSTTMAYEPAGPPPSGAPAGTTERATGGCGKAHAKRSERVSGNGGVVPVELPSSRALSIA